ncbi:MAG: hypothetical protein LBN26_02070 [Christensenellaceae bacterium]|jgi:K+-sensing histidine kinase KdpD|nr:hypothetical protein [Christensenellaceae bacterium]
MPIKKVMVCITNQKTCERLIARGMERSKGGAELHIVHCVQTGHGFMGTLSDGEAIEYLFTAAQLAGAELYLLRADRVEDGLANYAKDTGITTMILGGTGPGGGESIITRLERRLPEVEFDILL